MLMHIISWPPNTTDIIDEIRDTIGREITLYSEITGIPCPASGCALDPVTNLSINQFCPTCSGYYWINTVSGIDIQAHVRMRNLDIPVWTVGGFIIDGDAQFQIKYTVTNIEAVNTMKYCIIDGKEFIKKNIDLRGVPTVNRIVVTLIEKEG
jgi:hypothetical protein